VNLTGGGSVAVQWNTTIAWNTTGFDYGNYSVTAYATPVPEETDITDNTLVSWIVITITGDMDGNFKVQLYDLVLLAYAYGSMPNNSNWNPNADIDGNNVAGLSDLVTLAQHYGQHYP
jgi:hypothetical protein